MFDKKKEVIEVVEVVLERNLLADLSSYTLNGELDREALAYGGAVTTTETEIKAPYRYVSRRNRALMEPTGV